MNANFDYQADYREAQASGHHIDCDGYRLSHRWEVVRNEFGTFEAHCDECGKLGSGSSSMPATVKSMYSGHASEVPCDGRCRLWDAA